MANFGTLLLTSDSFANKHIEERFKTLIKDTSCKVAIITTAAKDKEENKYAQLTFQQFISFGFKEVDFIDFEVDSPDMGSYAVIYVCGGNTFKLLKYAKQANFGTTVRNLLDRGGVYIGVSAGSLIVGPSIQIANEIRPDNNEVHIEDFSGFSLTNHIIFPHYKAEYEREIVAFEAKHNVTVTRIKNGDALLIGEQEEIIQ